MPRRPQMNWRPTDADLALVARLRERLGLDSTAVIRYALRRTAQQEGIDMTKAEPTIECIYCGREVPGTGEEQTPAVDDDDAWAELARYHYPDCEWIATRAHRINI
jgi:hypothetical protein